VADDGGECRGIVVMGYVRGGGEGSSREYVLIQLLLFIYDDDAILSVLTSTHFDHIIVC